MDTKTYRNRNIKSTIRYDPLAQLVEQRPLSDAGLQ